MISNKIKTSFFLKQTIYCNAAVVLSDRPNTHCGSPQKQQIYVRPGVKIGNALDVLLSLEIGFGNGIGSLFLFTLLSSAAIDLVATTLSAFVEAELGHSRGSLFNVGIFIF